MGTLANVKVEAEQLTSEAVAEANEAANKLDKDYGKGAAAAVMSGMVFVFVICGCLVTRVFSKTPAVNISPYEQAMEMVRAPPPESVAVEYTDFEAFESDTEGLA